MIRVLYTAALLLLAEPCLSVPHPALINPVITSCNPGDEGTCSNLVRFSIDGVELLDYVALGPPNPSKSRKLAAMSIHCAKGSGPQGRPFSGCVWSGEANGHAPGIRNCELVSVGGWELTPTSTCIPAIATWVHQGADVGGECVVFVQTPYPAGDTPIHTIFGLKTATELANSGIAYCQKPLPPDAKCTIDVPPTIDHGTIAPSAHSVVSVDGTVDCGARPVIKVLGGGVLDLAPGVTAVLTASLPSSDRVVLTSTLETNGGTPGAHASAAIVIVSPY
ncbi:Uncharacterised protein [Serratia proteamaculans]|nr:Uncharacterised protein [Serratia proteamaculans]